ncbi:hypothetical protein O6H91_16G058300 [Diphasiastrum complanatum]|uniref:Uncharacterized protein n=1 Tax=Diphasiastrum complanatum TaxID=34168 RepID=A0ACC2BCK3_DIPCM|nr:hypothetical protein O6H91_16G058300 [Diphasiastrum complanatum]
MRVMGLEGSDVNEQKAFAEFLLRVGDGKEEIVIRHVLESICLPENMSLAIESLDDLIAFTFPDIIGNHRSFDFWKSYAILTVLNDDVDVVNARPNGLPAHVFDLKVGMIVMLLRSLAYQKGLCNRTQLIICRLGRQIIEAEFVSGKNVDDRVLIPRVPLVPTNSRMPFDSERLQFPIRTAFAMTINKAQGQTMEVVGLYLPRPVFSHGQLYVALSRVRKASCIRVLVEEKDIEDCNERRLSRYTPNVVYSEVL